MSQPGTVTVAPGVLRLLKTLLVSNLLIIVGVVGIAIGFIGVGNWTLVACGIAVALTTTLHIVAALRQRPRVVITPDGFAFEKLFGREEHRWEEVAGPFAVITIGISEAVAYRLTPEYKARTGRKSTSLYSGYDSAVIGSALPCSAAELAELLNQHKQRNEATGAATEEGGV
jgi:hypothetical protein